MAKETGRDMDPLISAQFALELQGVVTGYFTECSGLGSEHEVVEHKVVNDKGQEMIMMLPGRLKFNPITLKRGITHDMQCWEWRQKVEDGEVEKARINGSVVMFDRNYKEIARWDFENAWPSKCTGPTPKADGNEIALEEIEIQLEYLRRVT